MTRILSRLLFLVLLAASCGGAHPPAAPSFVAPAAATAGEIRLWQDATIFDAVHRLLASVGSGGTLWVEMYEFGRPDLASELRQARDRGADVRIVVDRTVPQSARTATRLVAAGLAVRAYPVDDSRHQIDHVKLLVAGDTALVGGMNWGVHSSANHDYVFETRAPDLVARLRAIFEQDWSLAGGQPAPLAATVGAVAQTTPGHEVFDRLLTLIGGARRSIAAEVFVLTDADVLAALAAAHRRGVRVRILLDPNQDVNRNGFGLLRSAGVEVRWYPVPVGALLHAKAGLFDDRQLLVGSANWSLSGLTVNHELDLVTGDSRATAEFASRFEQDWSASGS
jgi:cardiolipin synthase